MRRAPPCRQRKESHPRGMGAEIPQARRHDLHRPARPLRHHAARGRERCRPRTRADGRLARQGICDPGAWRGRGAYQQESQDAYGRDRDKARGHRHTQQVRSASVHNRGGERRRRRPKGEVPLPRPAPSPSAEGARAQAQARPGGAQLSRRAGLYGDRDTLPHQVHARGRSRLRGALEDESRHILRPAAVSPDLQAASDGGGIRPLLPDSEVLPRRGPACRPPARVHPDRL